MPATDLSVRPHVRVAGDMNAMKRRPAAPALAVTLLLAAGAVVAVARDQSAEPAPSPAAAAAFARSGLDELTAAVWNDRQRILEKDSGAVYEIYRRPRSANPAPRSEPAYFEALARVARGRKAGAGAVVQHFDRKLLPEISAEAPDRLSPYASWAAAATRSP